MSYYQNEDEQKNFPSCILVSQQTISQMEATKDFLLKKKKEKEKKRKRIKGKTKQHCFKISPFFTETKR